MSRLHPLWDKEKVANLVLETGVLPDMTRGTGRSTAIALRTIAEAIERPHIPINVRDHHSTISSNGALGTKIGNIIEALELKHLRVIWGDSGITSVLFERRPHE